MGLSLYNNLVSYNYLLGMCMRGRIWSSTVTKRETLKRKNKPYIVVHRSCPREREIAGFGLWITGGYWGMLVLTDRSCSVIWLPGEYGFDPLGVGKDPAFLKWYKEAEMIHGRWAMTAVVGIFVVQAWSGIPWFEAGADPGAIAFSFGTLLGTQLLLMGWVESKRWVDFFNPESQSVRWATPWSRTVENFANATGDQGYPGGKFFDPLSLAGTIKDGVYIPDREKVERLKLAEIKHARLAMVAMLIFYFEAGQGKTPVGALG